MPFILGVAMSPASILAYLQMSHFLMLIMVMSWIFSTFFFLPLCALAGPTENFGQLTFKKTKSADGRSSNRIEGLDENSLQLVEENLNVSKTASTGVKFDKRPNDEGVVNV